MVADFVHLYLKGVRFKMWAKLVGVERIARVLLA